MVQFFAYLFAVIFAISLHEYAHAKVAVLNGDITPKSYGRLTLNPLKHFDPIGFVMLIVLGFGFAKPVPVNANNFKRRKLGMFTVAIAGVTLNIIIAFLSFGFSRLFMMLGTATTNSFISVFAELMASFFEYTLLVNINLFLFNLIPIYPLDGFRVVESLTKFTNPVVKFLRDYGPYLFMFLMVWSIIVNTTHLPPNYDPLTYYISTIGGYIKEFFIWIWHIPK